MGSHAYEAGNSLNDIPDCLLHEEEEAGFKMGWQARYIAELCNLQPSEIGTIDETAPADWRENG